MKRELGGEAQTMGVRLNGASLRAYPPPVTCGASQSTHSGSSGFTTAPESARVCEREDREADLCPCLFQRKQGERHPLGLKGGLEIGVRCDENYRGGGRTGWPFCGRSWAL